MMIDRCAEVFKLPPRGRFGDAQRRTICLIGLARFAALIGAPCYVVAAEFSVDVRKRVGLPEIGESQDSLFRFVRPRVLRSNVDQIDVEHI